METAALKVSTDFIISIKNNDLSSFATIISDNKKGEIQSLMGYLGGAGVKTSTDLDGYLSIIIDLLNENLMEYLGDDYFEKIEISILNETNTNATAVYTANGCKKNILLINENGNWKVANFDDLEN